VKHGAHLVNDPHPTQNFFRRSDNYALAQQGIVAQTVSSFGLHKDYHQPSDELSTIDFAHMTKAIASMVSPIRWLANSNWKPEWNPGGKPEPPAQK
jgi:aminopeptidase-like protein